MVSEIRLEQIRMRVAKDYEKGFWSLWSQPELDRAVMLAEIDKQASLIKEMKAELETVEYEFDPPERVLSMLERASIW